MSESIWKTSKILLYFIQADSPFTEYFSLVEICIAEVLTFWGHELGVVKSLHLLGLYLVKNLAQANISIIILKIC